MNSTILQDITDVFAIFHDGVIQEWRGNQNILTIKIECKYLASGIHPSYSNFYLQCCGVDICQTTGAEILKNVDEVTKANPRLTVLYASIESNAVKIETTSGLLLFSCQGLKIFNHDQNQIGIDYLYDISKAYWDELSKKLEEHLLKTGKYS